MGADAYGHTFGNPDEQSSSPSVSQQMAVIPWMSASRENAHAAALWTGSSARSSSGERETMRLLGLIPIVSSEGVLNVSFKGKIFLMVERTSFRSSH